MGKLRTLHGTVTALLAAALLTLGGLLLTGVAHLSFGSARHPEAAGAEPGPSAYYSHLRSIDSLVSPPFPQEKRAGGGGHEHGGGKAGDFLGWSVRHSEAYRCPPEQAAELAGALEKDLRQAAEARGAVVVNGIFQPQSDELRIQGFEYVQGQNHGYVLITVVRRGGTQAAPGKEEGPTYEVAVNVRESVRLTKR